MGFYKNLMLEQQRSGFSTDRYLDKVCRHCIADPALATFVAGSGLIEECGFCSRTEVLGTELGALFHFMAECLESEWDNPLNEVGWDHGFHEFVDIIDSSELLWLLDCPLGNEDLHEEFALAFDQQWCQVRPYRLEPTEMLLLSWKHFSNIIKRTKRYLLHLTPPEPRDDSDELLDPTQVLDAIGDAIIKADSRMLKKTNNARIVRARAHDASIELRTSKELGSPPPGIARHNRMSGAGISMFYGAETPGTARAEIWCDAGHAITTGNWTPSRDLVYLDLPAALPIPSIFDTTARTHRTSLCFLHAFSQDLARPIDPDDAPIEYIPTQFATEYVRDHLRTRDGRSIDAIRYRSAVDNPTGVCWVVFVGQDACIESDDAAAQRATSHEDLLMILDNESVRRQA